MEPFLAYAAFNHSVRTLRLLAMRIDKKLAMPGHSWMAFPPSSRKRTHQFVFEVGAVCSKSQRD